MAYVDLADCGEPKEPTAALLPETWEVDKVKYMQLCYEDYRIKEERNRLIRERLEDQKRFHQICKELDAKR